jgi:hypothetical protein
MIDSFTLGPDLGRGLVGRAATPLAAKARNGVHALPAGHEPLDKLGALGLSNGQAQALHRAVSLQFPQKS